MLNYHNYNYKETPFTTTKSFDVHPLSYRGHDEYICKDSEVHYYLQKYGHIKAKDIIKKQDIPYNIIDSTQEKIISSPIKAMNEKEIKKPKVDENENKIQCLSEESIQNEIYNNSKGFKSSFSKGFYNKLNQQKKLLNIRTCKNNIKLVDSRYSQQYLADVKNLTKLSKTSTSTDFYRPKNYDGFESFNIPRVQLPNKNEYKYIKIHEDKIAKTFGSNKDNNLEEENERLSMILKKQNNTAFLRTANLPHIQVIVDQPKFWLKKTGTGTKMMGSRYNPFNFLENNKNLTKRNYLGALYQH
jgi:hypothetical protein